MVARRNELKSMQLSLSHINRKCFILFTFMLVYSTGRAQNPQRVERLARLQGLKIEFINRYLKLSSADSGFWQVYTPYNMEMRRAKLNSTDDIIGMEEKVLTIRKKYQPEFRKILVAEDRVQKVYTIDREFNKLVREEMQKRAEKMHQ
jgi:hypothetical protein